MDTERIDVRREPLVVRDGCAPDRIPAGRWPSDRPLARSEQFAVNEAVACRANGGDGSQEDVESRDWVFGVHAPPGTGVAEMFGDLIAAIVTERARRIADLADPAAAFGEPRTWGAYTVSEPAPELAGFEIVLTAPAADDGAGRSGPGLPPIGAAWRHRAARADYFASTARHTDGIGAWAMIAARLGDRTANQAFAERWWHGAVRGADVLFPAGESMAAALRRLKETSVYWPACVAWFRSALEKVQNLAEERMEVAADLTRLSQLEQACEEAAQSVETARARLAELVARERAAGEAVTSTEETYRAALAAFGRHELGKPELTTLTSGGIAALRSRRALLVALAGGQRRCRNRRRWSIARRELRAACTTAELNWEDALSAAEQRQTDVTAARSAVVKHAAGLSRLTTQLEPLAEAVATARQQWGDFVPVGPSQTETEDPVLIEWRETSALWADEEYARARAEAFIAALELHKALIVAQADVFESNLAALMELISVDNEPVGDAETGLAEVRRAAWRSFFLVVPVVQMPFEAMGPLLDSLAPGALGWLLADRSDQLAAEDLPGPLQWFDRAVFTGDTLLAGDTVLAGNTVHAEDTVLAEDTVQTEDRGLAASRADVTVAADLLVPTRTTAQDLANRVVRYGTWLRAAPSAGPCDQTEPRWVGLPLRVVRGQDRTTVDRRNDLAYDGLLIADRD